MSASICIIPARGGSKRIPRKNIKDFLGKPIIAYSITVALKSKLFDEVMVSTDDLEIADIAKSYGASVPFLRSVKTSDDHATTMEVLIEVLQVYKANGMEFDSVCCLYPTAVLSSANDLAEGFQLLKDVDIVLPVTEFSFPPMRSYRINEIGLAEFRYPEHMNTRSQDLETWYHDAGQWYWYNSRSITQGQVNLKRQAIKFSNLNVQDIDNLADWKLAELKYKLLLNEKH